jgi:hypothetical protein
MPRRCLPTLKRLAALVPPKRQNQIRDYGLWAAQAHDRDRLLALVPKSDDGGDGAGHDGRDGADPSDAVADPPASSPAGAGYGLRWAHRLARVFEHDLLRCDHGGARRTVIAAITDADVAAGILIHLGLPTETRQLAPPRTPPQTELFSDHEPVA